MKHHLNNILKYEVRKLCKGWVDSNKKEKEDNITDNYDMIKIIILTNNETKQQVEHGDHGA